MQVQGKRRVRILCALSWTAAGACAAPQIYFWEQAYPLAPCVPNWSQCIFRHDQSSEMQHFYAWFHLVAVFWAPLALLIPCYLTIILHVYKHQRASERQLFHRISNLSVNANNPQSFRRRVRKTSLLAVKVIGLYVLFWLPYEFFNLWELIDESFQQNPIDPFLDLFDVLLIINGCINPFLYTFCIRAVENPIRWGIERCQQQLVSYCRNCKINTISIQNPI